MTKPLIIAETPEQEGKRFLVSGASGMIGTSLVREWLADQIHVIRLIRHESGSEGEDGTILWNPAAIPPIADLTRLTGIHAAVHLSGANVSDHRWTTAYKQEIVGSRVKATSALVGVLARLDPKPRVLVCASAIGIYGDRSEEILTEDSSPGEGFLARTCIAWEDAARRAEEFGIRVVMLRFGVVLAPQGGAMRKLLPLFRMGFGGILGGGQQWMPWLTLRDAVGIINHCVLNEIQGPVNAVSPDPVRNAEFTRALGAAVRRPTLVPAPAFALRLLFGKMADEALLASAKVVPAKLLASGYQFADPEIGPAFADLLPF